MYIQLKKSNGTGYVYLVESFRKDDGSIGHRTLKKLGRLEDLTKDDPDALEKLRKEVKIKSSELRGAINKDKVGKLRNIAHNTRKVDYVSGLPQINYANYVIYSVWVEVLKLEYRLDYLQKRYHSGLKYRLSEILFITVALDILNLNPAKEQSGREVYGEHLGFLGIDYSYEEYLDCLEDAKRVVNEETLRILRFIVKNLSEQYGVEFLKTASSNMEQLHLNLDRSVLNDLSLDDNGDDDKNTISAEELVLTKEARIIQIFSFLRIIIMKIIKYKLQESSGQDYDFSLIRSAMQKAVLLVDYPFDSNSSFLYIKRDNGESVLLMNQIMKAVGLQPLLNIIDKIELGHRLHTKFKEDRQIIPAYIYNKLPQQ
ncbi:MAG: hypothetical protein K6F05_03835 [Succinivibrio sp.]|nr:hypothetical protein [Succinivibrio sp.]